MRFGSIILLVFLFSCSEKVEKECNYITDYYPIIYQADYEFSIENYEKAFQLYKKAFKNCEARNTMEYNEIAYFAETAAILKKYEVAKLYAEKLILRGSELSRFYSSENFNDFMDSEYGKALEANFPELRKQFMENTDFKLRDELISMRNADQMYRSQRSEADWTKQDSIDKIHEKRLIELFETVGYPDEEMVGPYSYDQNNVNAGIFMLHTDDSIRMNYFVPKIREFVENGTCAPRVLGTMIDQFYLYNDEPQIYGTYTMQGGGYATMIEDRTKVDSNRISIGLSPLVLKEKKDSIRKIKYGF